VAIPPVPERVDDDTYLIAIAKTLDNETVLFTRWGLAMS
jgi:hypothetical protein